MAVMYTRGVDPNRNMRQQITRVVEQIDCPFFMSAVREEF